ncbi:MAG: tRNA pseudouridine(38-40) synthase TruA [Verrucomicrobiota bacterium]
MPTKYAIQIAYDGTDYCGWQIQRGVGSHANTKPSVQEEITAAIRALCDEEVTLVASGRTDAGVHASGQVAHFSLESPRHSHDHFLDGLNDRLPKAIRIHRLGRVPEGFRAQQTIGKQYSYYFSQGPTPLPHLERYTMWNRHPLDPGSMQEALGALVGEHDFFAFCGAQAKVSSTVRKICEAEVTSEAVPPPGCFDVERQSLLRVRIAGSGFLKQMVRGIAGTLKQIGEGRRPATDMAEILNTRDREHVGPTAPANGLWLDCVWYEPHPEIAFLNHPSPSWVALNRIPG